MTFLIHYNEQKGKFKNFVVLCFLNIKKACLVYFQKDKKKNMQKKCSRNNFYVSPESISQNSLLYTSAPWKLHSI